MGRFWDVYGTVICYIGRNSFFERKNEMKNLTRRQFLERSALAGLGLTLMGSRPLAQAVNQPLSLDKASLFKEIELTAKETLTTSFSPGMSVSAVFANKPFYAKGFGVMDIEERLPYTAQTVQGLGSLSKAFTSVAVMQLVEAGKMSIDQKLVELVPYFQLKDPRYKDITIRHILAHTSGLPGLFDADFLNIWTNPRVDDGAITRYVKSLKDMDFMMTCDPGIDPAKHLYSEMGYDLLAAVVQEVSGEIFEHYCQKHILKPLRMSHSSFLKPEIPPGLLATPYIRDAAGKPVVSPVYPYNRVESAGAGLLSDANDMLNWMQMLLNGGALNGVRILSPASAARLFEPLVDFGDTVGYGWGWWQWYDDYGLNICHRGAIIGCNSIVYLLPSMGLGVTAMGNCLGSMNEWPPYAGQFGVWLFARLVGEMLAAQGAKVKGSHKLPIRMKP
jgi:CubicO group peptidase (beta-lactamase class C family)